MHCFNSENQCLWPNFKNFRYKPFKLKHKTLRTVKLQQAAPPPAEVRFTNSEPITTASLCHQDGRVWCRLRLPACGAEQPVTREAPWLSATSHQKPCSHHLGQGGSMWPVPAKSVLVFKVKRFSLFVCFICLLTYLFEMSCNPAES